MISHTCELVVDGDHISTHCSCASRARSLSQKFLDNKLTRLRRKYPKRFRESLHNLKPCPLVIPPEFLGELSPERKLICAIVERAMQDARGNVHYRERHFTQTIEREAWEWFNDDSIEPFSWHWCQQKLNMPRWMVNRVLKYAVESYIPRSQRPATPIRRRVSA